MIDINDYDIQCIKHEILWKYDKSPCDYPDCDCLLSLRKDMINERVLANQEEILPDIIAFNDVLTAALRELYDRTHRIWDSIKDNADFKDVEQHSQYKSNWEYWRNKRSFLRVWRDNNWVIDSVDEELIVKMMHDIMNSDYYHKLPDWVKYVVLLSIITYDLYVDFSYLFVCEKIADLVLRNNKELTENGLVDLFDIIQWREAYQFENFGRFRRLQQVNKRLLAKSNIKV